tara:strand:+ start:20 stop:727 length:708 start_codon:yes stop_codon:yes gene_type:complete
METIQSLINQSFKNFEIIIVYDDTNLDELNFVKKIKKKYLKIKLIINKNILGPGLSRNKGIFLSKGKYIAFCDADDLWNKNKLKFQLEYMKKNNLNFSHSNYFVIDKLGKKIGNFKVKKKINYKELLKSCDIGLSSVIVKKSILKNKNIFCKLKTKEDFYLWLKIIKKEKNLFGINRYLVSWRKLSSSLSSSILQRLLDAFRLYYIYEKFDFFTSFFYVIRLSYFAYLKKINIYR